MDSSSSYLEEFLESIEVVPPLCKRNFTLMRNLDRKANVLSKEVEAEQEKYILSLKAHIQRQAQLPKASIPKVLSAPRSSIAGDIDGTSDKGKDKTKKKDSMEIDSGLDSKGKGRGKDDSKTNIAKTAKNEPETRVSRAQAEWDKAQQELDAQLARIEDKRQKMQAIHVEKEGVARQTAALVDTQIGSLDQQLNHFERWLREKGSWETGGGLRPGDEVAAKMSATENLWILAQVLHYFPPGSVDGNTPSSGARGVMGAGLAEEMYEVCDADDNSRRYVLPLRQLVELPDPDSTTIDPGQWAKGDRVLAMYPDTTSFYLATVSHVVPRRDRDKDISELHLQVQFDDDHDETGFIPHRPVPLRFVLEVP